MIRMKPFHCHFKNSTWKFLQIYFNKSTIKGDEDNEEDANEIDSKSAVNSFEALAIYNKLQVFFEENDVENEVLRSVTSLT